MDDAPGRRVDAAREGTEGSDHHPEIDWVAAECSPEFRELVRKRKRFVIPATIFFMAWYFGFIVLAGYAPDFMGESVHEGLTVGYVLALTQFLMVWGLGWLYLRRADRDFDPLAREAAEVALRQQRHGASTDRPADGPTRTQIRPEEEASGR